MSENDEVQQHPRLEAAVESTFAKLLGRYGIPLLLVMLGYFVREELVDIKTTQGRQGEDITAIKSDLRDVNTRLDAQVLRQVETNTKRLDKVDERLQRVERRFGP